MNNKRQRLSRTRQELEEIRQERAELGNPHSRELKILEEPIDKSLKYLDKNHTKDKIDVHRIIEILQSFENDVDPSENLLEMIGESYSMEEAKKDAERLEAATLGRKIKANMMTEELGAHVLTELDSIEHFKHDLLSHMVDIHLETMEIQEMAAMAYEGADLDEQPLDFLINNTLNKVFESKSFYSKRTNGKQLIQDYEIELSLEPRESLVEELMDYCLDEYREAVEKRSEVIGETREEETIPQNSQNFDIEENKIDWNNFQNELGSAPSEEMREFYEAAVTYHQEDQELTSDLLGKIIADLNGMNPDYTSKEKCLADNFGNLKKEADNVEEFNFRLPTRDKQRYLERITDTVDRLEEFYEKEVYSIER